MKNVKTLLIFIITSTLLLASAQRVNSLGGNVGYWADDDNSWTAFPHTINNSNLAQVSGIGSDGNHNAIVRWGEGNKWGFSWNQANANDMINLQWGNGSMGVTFGLNMSSEDDGDDTNGKATSGRGISASWGQEMGFGDLGVGFSNSSYDDGNADSKHDPASMGLWVNLRRPQALWIFDNMLVGFTYNANNSGNGMVGYEGDYTNTNLVTSLYKHISISDNTTGLIAMGFGFNTKAGAIGYQSSGCYDADGDGVSDIADTDACTANAATNTWLADGVWGNNKDYTSTTISLPTWTFAVESGMTDWATARVGVNANYNLSDTENAGATTSKDETSMGGVGMGYSMGLGFNYGSFNLDVDVSEGLFTNPVQHVTGYQSIAPVNATATLTYAW